jgi:hypothetical protein
MKNEKNKKWKMKNEKWISWKNLSWKNWCWKTKVEQIIVEKNKSRQGGNVQ